MKEISVGWSLRGVTTLTVEDDFDIEDAERISSRIDWHEAVNDTHDTEIEYVDDVESTDEDTECWKGWNPLTPGQR